MRVAIVVAHPSPASFSHAIAGRARARLLAAGHEVSVRDLYQERFDPILAPEELDPNFSAPGLATYLDEVKGADAFVIVHPNWWGQPPAILKGWVDRVLRVGVAYAFAAGEGADAVPVGLLRARTALVFNTSNTPPSRESEVFGDPLDTLWRNCIFHYCGVRRFVRRTFSTIAGSSESRRAEWLDEVERMIDAELAPDTVATTPDAT